jgi:hypothetical protein
MNDSTQSTARGAAPVLTMENYRTAMFRAMVTSRVHAGATQGKTPEQVAADIASEQRALAKAITEPAVVDVASNALMRAQAEINGNPRYQSTPEQAHESVQQIMKRRAVEANQFADLLAKPSYVQPLAAMTVAQAEASIPRLQDIKMKEVLSDLLHLENGAPQVIAHIEATAKGTMLEHDALANMFAAKGDVHEALMGAMARHLPQASKDEIHSVVAGWLKAREDAARTTSALSANDGAAYLEAVRQSTQWHRNPPATHAAPAEVAVAAAAPVIPQEARTAAEIEHEKTQLQRAEDVSYTINHALSCGMTDVVLQPLIAAAFGINVGCGDPNHHHDDHGHDHKHDHGHTHGPDCNHHDHPPAKRKLTFKSFTSEAWHYFKGEIFGDFVAVPLTIGVQRFFPGFMKGLRSIFEPLLGWAFRMGANHSAQNWGKQQGLASDAPEVVARAQEMYEHEVSHLPQAVVWNMFAYPLGAIAQKMDGHHRSYPEIFKSKLVGAAVSNSILIGGRMLAPGAAEKWDQATGEKIFMPLTRKVGKLFGIEEKTMEKALNKKHQSLPEKAAQPENANWAKRLESEPATQQVLGNH